MHSGQEGHNGRGGRWKLWLKLILFSETDLTRARFWAGYQEATRVETLVREDSEGSRS